ncbi:MAG: methyl-accepting chemotaxis protein [Ruminiclostridium sp.]|nr:methyl-accepting chemotaxis protein [Ruminiclostridium sp.]
MKKRLMRLGILCAGIGSFAVALAASVLILIIENQFSAAFGATIAGAAVSSIKEESEYLPDGLSNAAPGEHSDIFDNVFALGDSTGYDYSDFISDAKKLSSGGVCFAYIPSAKVNLVALNRGSDIIVGELEQSYFDYAVNIMGGEGTYGLVVNSESGKILLSSDKSKVGGTISGDPVYSEVLPSVKAGKAASSGGVFSKVLVYTVPVKDHPEFTVVYCTDASNVYRSGKIGTTLMFLWAIILTITAVIVSIGVARKISDSINPTVECLDKFSRGEIDTSFKANDRGDETEALSTAMEKTINNLGLYIRDIDTILSSISEGDLTVESSCVYEGDFNNIKRSLDKISVSLKDTIGTIRQAGEQVNSGVTMLSGGAQSLANNSSTEASTIKELDALVKNINENVTANAEMTERMRGLSEQTVRNVENGNASMRELSDSIEDIRKASEEIQTIAKLIDDIAFQTNILALNAAVEAARAGDAGKGFAVVADEVRNLASKSAEAAKDAVQVIGRCVAAVDRGVQLNDSASRSLSDVSRSVQEFSMLVGKVAESSGQQARDIGTVNTGLTDITSVIQSNAATAQQSAASTEQLASQAQILDQQLKHFNI